MQRFTTYGRLTPTTKFSCAYVLTPLTRQISVPVDQHKVRNAMTSPRTSEPRACVRKQSPSRGKLRWPGPNHWPRSCPPPPPQDTCRALAFPIYKLIVYACVIITLAIGVSSSHCSTKVAHATLSNACTRIVSLDLEQDRMNRGEGESRPGSIPPPHRSTMVTACIQLKRDSSGAKWLAGRFLPRGASGGHEREQSSSGASIHRTCD